MKNIPSTLVIYCYQETHEFSPAGKLSLITSLPFYRTLPLCTIIHSPFHKSQDSIIFSQMQQPKGLLRFHYSARILRAEARLQPVDLRSVYYSPLVINSLSRYLALKLPTKTTEAIEAPFPSSAYLQDLSHSQALDPHDPASANSRSTQHHLPASSDNTP